MAPVTRIDAEEDVIPMKKTFKNPEFQFGFLLTLGASYHQGSDVGECLETARRIKNGDAESWFVEWSATADRIRQIAESCHVKGHLISAREAFLRASTYYSAALGLIDSSKDPSRMMPTWEQHRSCWDHFVDLTDPAGERIAIPYKGTTLPGYFFSVDRSGKPRPLLIMNNGSDGPTSSMWTMGGAEALERGYNFMTFDGPGQQAALFKQNIGFRHDWEKVITPVVDCLLGRTDVDARRITLLGVSQAGYWVPRAVAFEHRIAAAIADPGVWDVGAQTWFKSLPRSMAQLLDSDDPVAKAKFNRNLEWFGRFSKATRRKLDFRMRPYLLETPYDTFKAIRQYTMRGVARLISCPMLITDPENEQFWPGESQTLYNALTCPKTLITFATSEGADGHCEPTAGGLREQRIFDWLDETLMHV